MVQPNPLNVGYDGPFRILSAVDNRRYKRRLYDVLDHDPTHDDIRAFLRRLQTALAARDWTLLGITTDGSPLYPTPLAEVFRGVPHQLCQFHVVKDIVKAVVKAVSSERKRLAAQQPKSLNFSFVVARHIWRRRGVSPCCGRAHRLHRRAPLRGLLVPMASIFDLL